MLLCHLDNEEALTEGGIDSLNCVDAFVIPVF